MARDRMNERMKVIFRVQKQPQSLFVWHTFHIFKTTQEPRNTTQISTEKLQYVAGNAHNERIQRAQRHVSKVYDQLTHIHISDRGSCT